jgi:hypothetical protein
LHNLRHWDDDDDDDLIMIMIICSTIPLAVTTASSNSYVVIVVCHGRSSMRVYFVVVSWVMSSEEKIKRESSGTSLAPWSRPDFCFCVAVHRPTART